MKKAIQLLIFTMPLINFGMDDNANANFSPESLESLRSKLTELTLEKEALEKEITATENLITRLAFDESYQKNPL